MAKIQYLLKFGQRGYLESFVNGNLYCSNAITFWGIEDKLKIKGQGDVLEAGTKIFAQKMVMRHPDTHEVIADFGKANGLARVEPAEKMPVFCMFTVYEDDCIINKDGEIVINLPEDKRQTIREHFPNADAVAIIPNPKEFVEDIRKSVNVEIKAESVRYFHIDKGFKTNDSQVAMDLEYIKYVCQDVPPIKDDRKIIYKFCTDYAFRALFCKDVFFEREQEFRIVLPNERIEIGKSYPVHFSTEYKICDLKAFFDD